MAAQPTGFDMSSIPGAGSFLDQIGSGLGRAAVGALTGNPSGRMTDEQFKENETRADWDNQRQVTRDNTYLAGVTPQRADSYNTYQDATYLQDIGRKTEGIKSMASGLGMSPWEITGTGSAGQPTQLGSDSKGSGQSAQFMAQTIPLQIAKMNNQTQLAATQMNNSTQKDITKIQQGIGDDNSGGRVPKTLAGMQRFLAQGTAKEIQQRIDVSEAQMIRDNLQFILNNLPAETIDLGLYSSTSKRGWRTIVAALGPSQGEGNDTKQALQLQRALKSMPSDELDATRNDLIELLSLATKAAKGGASAVAGAGKAVSSAGKFLGNLGKKKIPGTGLIGKHENLKIP